MKYKSKNKIDYRMVINSREIAVIGLVCTLFSGVATVAAAISGAGMAVSYSAYLPCLALYLSLL